MKKVYFLLLTVLFATIATNAQVANYSFAASSGTYTALAAPTNVYSGTWDDNSAVSVPIGFTFNFNGVGYTTVFVHPNGYLSFGTSTSGYVPISGGSAVAGVASGYGRDLQSQNTAPIGSVDYLSTGGVFTVQWSNTRRYNGSTVNAERFEMQIQLVQTTNVLRFVYGTWSDAVSATTTNVGEVGLRGTSGTDFKNLSVLTGGSWASPAAGAVNNATIFYNESSVATKPATGQTYTFTPPPPCVAPANSASGLILTAISTSQINGSFTAAPADGYLTVRYPTGATPVNPVNGTNYLAGTSLGTGQVVQSSAATTFSATGLTPSTTYDFYVYPYNNLSCSGGPTYKTSSPASGSQSTNACGGLPPGTYTVGPTGTYASLTAAIAATAAGTTGAVIFELQSTYLSAVETFPVTIPANPCVTSLVIRPELGASGLSITSANATATIDFNGGTNVTIDGRPGGVGTTSQLNIINSNTAGVAIRLINDASNNTITYCDVQGQNTSNTSSATVGSGVIYFGGTTTASLLGNDNNTISFSNVHGAGAAFPAIGISSTGTVTNTVSYNDNNTITNCNIYDFFIATTASTGIKTDAGNSAWTITNNSLYQTASRTYTTAATHRALWITPNTGNLTPQASGFVITGNSIGGSAPGAGGTAYTMLGSIANIFNGMDLSVGLGTATSVQNNTVANIALTTTSTGNNFVGIGVANGHVNIGTVTGNIIGSGTGTGSIVINQTTSNGGTVYGIRLSGGTSTTLVANNNTVGSFTINGSAATISANFIGIGAVGGTTTSVTINGNIVGSTSTANSINQTSTGTANVALSGITVTSGATGATSISNNTIANMNSNCTSTGVVKGINASIGVLTVTGNTIRDLSTQTTSVGTGSGCGIVGISITSTSAGHTISGNKIHSLVLNSVSITAAIQITGIFYSGTTTGTNTISKNLIHSFDVTAVNPFTTITGIDIGGGTSMFANNMIRLGINAAGASITTPLTVRGITIGTTSTNNINFNSIYLGGTGVGTNANNTFAFNRSSTSGVHDVRDNIFVNNRSNATTGGIHYAVKLAASTTVFPVLDYNVYQYTGTGGKFANNGAIDFSTYAAGWIAGDVNSAAANPQYINPTGTAATLDLHIHATNPTPVEGTGVNIVAVTDDYDAQVRASLTPVDIGADAGNFVLLDIFAPVISYTALTPICVTGDRTLTGVIITDATGVPTTGTFRPRIYYRKNAGAWFSQGGTLTSGTGTNGTWSFDIIAADMGGLVIGDVVSYYIIAQDLAVPANIGSNPGGVVATDVNNVTTPPASPNSYVIAATLNGTYTVGAGGNYTTLSAAVNAYNTACLTGPVVFSLTDATYPGETFPISINANANASAVNTLTIKPATGVNAGISGSSASGLIVLNGSDYVTINGSNTNTPNTICPLSAASRNLTITNTNAGTSSAVVWLQWLFVGVTPKSAQNNSVINCNIVGNSNTTTLFGIGSGSTTIATTSLGYLNNNNSFINNNISKTQYGIFTIGQSAVDKNQGTVINQNLINTAAPDNIGIGGISAGFENNISISGNNVSGINLAASTDVFAIAAGFLTANGFSTTTAGANEATNVTITQNTIGSIVQTTTFASLGIALGTAATGTSLIANNMVSGVASNATSPDFSAGIVAGGGAAQTNIYNNTVSMQGTITGATAATQASTCLAVTAATTSPIDIRNNIFSNTQAGNAGATLRFAAIALRYASPYTGLVSNNNDLYSAGAGPGTYTIGVTGGLTGTNRLTLAAWQTETGQDAASKNVLPVFVSATDLHLQTGPVGTNWCLNSSGANLPSVTIDIDCQTRTNPPDIGADEFVPVGDALAAPSSQTICSGATITTIVLSGTATSFNWTRDNTVAVTGIAASGTGNISGALTNTTLAPVTVTFTITPVNASGCFGASITATVTVNPNNTITLTSAPGTDAQTVCLNTPITNITYATTSATGATFSGLPAGVTGAWAANVVTISGTPTVTGVFSYTVTLTGGCGTVTAIGTITVNNNTITLTSAPGTDAQTVCINTAITNITYSTTGATGATFSGLPAGVTGAWAANVVTISGTATVAGTFSYTVTLTGGCGSVTANGTITVTPAPNATIAYAGSPYCQNAGTATVTRTGTAGGTYSSTAGLTINAATGDVTLGTSTPGTYTVTYTVAASGGCALYTTTTTITITAPPVATIAYAGSPYCTVSGTATVTQTGTAGGTYSSTAGLTINATTGDVTLGTSTPGTYTVTYSIAASGGCPLYTTTASITVLNCLFPCVETFDAVTIPALPLGWTVTTGTTCAGSAPWTTVNTASSSAPNSAGTNDPGCISDEYLDSRVFTVAATSSILTFRNSYDLEASGTPTVGYDGMVLEISINGGAFADIITAGGSFVTGGYDRTISGSFSSPIANRQAWSGNSGGFITTTVNLPAAALGQNVVFRWRRATDSSVGAVGAWVDDVSVTVSATIAYAGSPYCSNAGTATVTRTGTAGGTYSSTAGLTINATTGDVTLGTSTPGTYTVTYTIAASGSCPVFTTTTTITITAAPAATISYPGSPYCSNAGTANVTRTGTAGGTYSSTAGLTLNASTGAVTLGTSTPGTYTVTYTIAASGGCAVFTTTASITITAAPAATISYAGSPYCSTDLTATVTRTGTAGGTYSSTAGLTINATTGTVTPSTSTPGTYTVTYTIAAGGGCGAFSTTTTITITQAPNAIIFYLGTPYCSNAGTATVSQFGTPGGTYSAAPAGLTINATTGAVTLATSTPGTYTVTYTIPAGGGCGITITTTTITITAAPAATISYAGSPYCANAGTANVTRTGTAGGTYSSTAGLTLNATTGAVTLGTSTPGTYVVTYTIAASGGCATFTTTASITITALPAATIAYTGSPYCSNAGTATVTRTGTAGGTYSAAPAGLSINATTGDVNLGTSTAGTYTVTYTLAAGGGCPVVTATTTITITTLPAATISYTGSPYCQNAGTATVTRTGTAGGTYSAAPAGLSINATTGLVTLGTSTPGTYTVTYTIAAGGGCGVVTATTSITVSSLSVAPTGATASSTSLCGPTAITLSVTGGSLGSGATWRWYTGSCGGTLVGTGATLNLTVSATTTYYVRAEGPCNTTTCASVTVTVNVQPTVVLTATLPTSLMPGQTSTLTATVTPADPTNTTVWYRNGIVVPGATGLTRIVGVDALGLYTVRTTTTAGCTALSNAVLIKDSASAPGVVWIYPNPNSGQFSIRYYSNAQQLGFVRHVILYNQKGQKVWDETYPITGPYSNMNVDARKLPSGTYVVVLTDAFKNEILAKGSVVIVR